MKGWLPAPDKGLKRVYSIGTLSPSQEEWQISDSREGKKKSILQTPVDSIERNQRSKSRRQLSSLQEDSLPAPKRCNSSLRKQFRSLTSERGGGLLVRGQRTPSDERARAESRT